MQQPDSVQALAPLKDFQRRTVDHAFTRLFEATDRSRRFLVADEVGLGKTLVARGVIARTIDHLWNSIDRIDIIYICSNADIARQNINRLHPNSDSSHNFALATRITLLPLQIQNLKHNKLNFISFTPGTSFNMGMSGGKAQERALLFYLLESHWEMRGKAPYKVFRDRMSLGNFQYAVKLIRQQPVDSSLAQAFLSRLEAHENELRAQDKLTLRTRYEWLREQMASPRAKFTTEKGRWRQNHLLGQLRLLLAAACVDALEPDLIILDEFQRFKSLLEGSDAAGELAKSLFSFRDAHTLLLSATPYKMYTLADEQEDDDHYRDFLRTVRFLYSDDDVHEKRCDVLLKSYRQTLLRGDATALTALKDDVESLLRKVMARTEKLSGTADRNALLKTIFPEPQLAASELHSFVTLHQLAQHLAQPVPLSYWQSAPYLLNFMRNYQIKRAFDRAHQDAATVKLVAEADSLLLNTAGFKSYAAIDANNARLRTLLADTIDKGAWRLLWLPPALPYYQLGAPFAQLPSLTKRLVFSSWDVVPRAVAPLVSYAAERAMVRSFEDAPLNSREARAKRGGLLQFAMRDERLTGMPTLALLYPCAILAALGDPLTISAESRTIPAIKAAIAIEIKIHLAALPLPDIQDGRADERWYWAAPILLDRHFAPEMNAFWQAGQLAAVWRTDDGGGDSAWSEHVNAARALWQHADTADWGRVPDDLVDILTLLALGGLAIVPLRAFGRVVDSSTFNLATTLQAGRVAWALRSLFNSPEATVVLRGQQATEPYWRQLLQYAIAGCLQSVLDEYCHVLRESLGLFDYPPDKTVAALAATMQDVMTLRTPALAYDDISIADGQLVSEQRRIRTHFALRFGDLRDDQQQLTRKESVRQAFNAPFWPFVLISTSIGQEGLDFHLYCHAIVHWNLPANPVDLEQREGRIHRYKSHAVRKNLAAVLGDSVLLDDGEEDSAETDPWQVLFASAHAQRKTTSSDLIPYWIYPEQGAPAAHIERHIPALPLSRDRARFERLRRALTVYRMAFGQNRQEDLLDYLLTRFSEKDVQNLMAQAQISLQP